MRKFPIAAMVAATALSLAACGESHDGVRETTAKASCETWVDQALNADGEHQNVYDRQAWEIDGGYRIHSHVDVTNALGGVVRYEYECKVTDQGGENPDVVVEYLEPAQ